MSRVYDVFLSVRAWLHDEGESPMTPDYINDILARTAVSKQRPAWQSPWRWLLMRTTDTIRTVPRIAWPVLILLIIAALAFGVAASLPPALPNLEGTYATPPVDLTVIATAIRRAGYDFNQFDLPGAQNATSEFRLTFHNRKLDVRTVFDDPVWSGTYNVLDNHTFRATNASTEEMDVNFTLNDNLLVTDLLDISDSDPHILADVAAIFGSARFARVPEAQPPCATQPQIAPAASTSSDAALPEGAYATASMTPPQVAALIDAAGLPAAPDFFSENGLTDARSIVFALCFQTGPASFPQMTWWQSLDGGPFTMQSWGTYHLPDDHTVMMQTDFPETTTWDFTLKDDVLQLALTDFLPATGDLGAQQATAAITSAPFHRMR